MGSNRCASATDLRTRKKGGILFPRPSMSPLMRLAIGTGVLVLLAGCGLLPEIAHQPTYHNPFPQLTKVAIAPFFNLSTEPTVDGRQFANAYFHELQAIPGFEVVPVGTVEEKARELNLSLANPVEVRKLAEALEVDAIVIGAITDFSPYYPPRCALQVEWYTANPCFHTIPVGYGLPWGTTEEEYIPDTLVLETELGLAREQLKTQTPHRVSDAFIPINDGDRPQAGNLMAMLRARDTASAKTREEAARRTAAQPKRYSVQQLGHRDQASAETASSVAAGANNGPKTLSSVVASRSKALSAADLGEGELDEQTPAPSDRAIDSPAAPSAAPERLTATNATPIAARGIAPPTSNMQLPPDWPDPRGLVPPGPSYPCADCKPTYEPVMRHTRTYNGNDVRFTTALESYVFFRDDARIGGWQSYLQRSDDFIRFCCHMHLAEMLTARGGAGETRVVWRWPERR